MTTEQKHTITIPGLPEGWRAVAYRRPVSGEYYFYNDDIQRGTTGSGQFLIVEKIKPRRIVLEETDEENVCDPDDGWKDQWFDDMCLSCQEKIWRVVEEE